MRQLTIILVTVLVAALAATVFVVKYGSARKAQLARDQAEIQDSLTRTIEALKVPPEAIYYDYDAQDRIGRIRQWVYQKHGTKDYVPYVMQTNAPPWQTNQSKDGTFPNRVSTSSFGNIINGSYEYYWIGASTNACQAIQSWFRNGDKMGPYLREHPDIYKTEIRPRLILLTESYTSRVSVAACQALIAAGEDRQAWISRLEEIHLEENDPVSYAADALKALGCKVPPLPGPLSGLPSLNDPAAASSSSGDALPPGVLFRLGDTCMRQGSEAGAKAFSPDGKTLASAGTNSDICLWDAATGKLKLRIAPGKFAWIRQLVFVSDSAIAILDNKALWLWRIDQPKARLITLEQEPPHSYIALSPDGKELFGGDLKGSVQVYDLPSCKRDRNMLAPAWFGADSGKIDSNSLPPIPDPAPVSVYATAMSPDKRMVALKQGNRICLCDLAAKRELFPTDSPLVAPVILGESEGRLYTIASERLYVWDLAARKLLPSPLPPKERILGAALSPKLGMLATCGRRLRERDAAHPNNKWDESYVKFWDLTGKPQAEMVANDLREESSVLVFSPTSERLALLNSHVISIWSILNLQDIRLQYRFADGDDGNRIGLAFLPTHALNLLTLDSRREGVTLYSTSFDMKGEQFNPFVYAWGFALSSDGGMLAVASEDWIYLRDVSNCARQKNGGVEEFVPLKRFRNSNEGTSAMAWLDSANNFLLTAQRASNFMVLWDAKSGKPLGRLTGHGGAITSTWSNGRTLYTAGEDTTVMAWDVAKIKQWCEARQAAK